MTIVEFLQERLAEDEQAARNACAVAEAHWHLDEDGGETVLWWPPEPEVAAKLRNKGMWREASDADEWRGQTIETCGERIAPHIARWDPARVLAEVEAKRAVLAQFEAYMEANDWDWGHVRETAWEAVRHMAAVYSDHSDYKEEWKP